jgi:hypothetical protein
MAARVSLAHDMSTMGQSLQHVCSSFKFDSTPFLDSFYFCPVKTGRWGGVVTAFITMSDIKDEIDWEFPGATTTQGQSNFFWQGVIRAWAL